MPALEQQECYVDVPETVSPEAQKFLRTLVDPALMPAFPEPDNLAGWEKVRAVAEANGKALSGPLLKRYGHTVAEVKLGGVPALDIRPQGWKDNGRVVVYTHGGAHVMFSAASTLGRAVIAACETGLRLISIDYTVAPLAKYNAISDQVVPAIQALVKNGQRLEHMTIYGDSSGGGLAAAAILKMRDQGLRMPAAAVLVSAWLDVTPSGDTETTLRETGKTSCRRVGRPKGSETSVRVAGVCRLFQRVPTDPHSGRPQGDAAQRLCPLLSRPRHCRRSREVGPLRGDDSQLQDRFPDAPESILARWKMRAFLHHYLEL